MKININKFNEESYGKFKDSYMYLYNKNIIEDRMINFKQYTKNTDTVHCPYQSISEQFDKLNIILNKPYSSEEDPYWNPIKRQYRDNTLKETDVLSSFVKVIRKTIFNIFVAAKKVESPIKRVDFSSMRIKLVDWIKADWNKGKNK